MSVYGRIDIEYQGTEPVTDFERSTGTILEYEEGGAAPGSK